MTKADATVEIERIAYNAAEGAAALGISGDTMGGLIRIGRVPHVQLGQRVLIGKRALEQWLTSECLANVGQRHNDLEPIALGSALPVRRRNRRSGGGSI